jgi:nuclear transport factor 2 (NTF2) superfamily protein
MAHIVPPFTAATAFEKVKFAQNAWNTKDPETIAMGAIDFLFVEKPANAGLPKMPAYTKDCIWRNRDQFIRGQEEIKAFLTKKYANEHGYRLKKELFAFQDNKIVSLALLYRFLLSQIKIVLAETHICNPGCSVLLRVSR